MTDSQALLQEGLAAFRARAYDEALRAWRTLLSFEPDHPQVKELVARTETLAAEGQVVHQLKEELADLREELATTRDSRNELLLEMARVHKRYEEREARLWRMQEAREWELREALANAELQSIQFRSTESRNLSDQELLAAAENALQRPLDQQEDEHALPSSNDQDEQTALEQANEKIRVLRNELQLAHERIVELEQAVLQYEHDEKHSHESYLASPDHNVLQHAVYDALEMSEEEQAVAFDHIIAQDDEEDEEAFGFLAPAAFQAVESQRIETAQDINEDPLFGKSRKETQTTNLSDDFNSDDAPDDDFTGPLIADEVLNPPESDASTASMSRSQEGSTRNLERNVIDRNDPPTGSFDPAFRDEEDVFRGVASDDEPVVDALFDIVKEETSGMIHLASSAKQQLEPTAPSSLEAVSSSDDEENAAAMPAVDSHDEEDEAAMPAADSHDEEDEEDAPADTHPPAEEPDVEAPAAGTSSVDDKDIHALPPARPRDESIDTAEIDLHPVEDKNLADGFSDELADALSSTPEPPRLITGILPELPDIDFMEDEPEHMSPEELERRGTWIPVRHQSNVELDDPVASYLLTHIDGVSTFMELRGTVGLPPAAVDSGFRTLLGKDIIRVKQR